MNFVGWMSSRTKMEYGDDKHINRRKISIDLNDMTVNGDERH